MDKCCNKITNHIKTDGLVQIGKITYYVFKCKECGSTFIRRLMTLQGFVLENGSYKYSGKTMTWEASK